MCEKGFDFLFAIGHVISRLHVVVKRKASDPIAIRTLGVDGIVVQAHHVAHFVEAFLVASLLLTL